MSGTEIRLVFNHVPAVILTLHKREDNLARDLAVNVREGARAKAPKRTGNLTRTIHTEKVSGAVGSMYITQANTKYIDPTLRDYAAYNEFGTRYMAAQPYMMPAYHMMLALLYPIAEFSMGLPIEISAKTGRAV